jgi:hypothetical protein
MDMASKSSFAIVGLLCILICVNVSNSFGQTIGSPALPGSGSWFGGQRFPAGSPCGQDCWSAVSVHAGWMIAPARIRVGYDGLVLPGACVSSYFVYPLTGVELGASLPLRLSENYALRVYGTYLLPYNSQADQEITWTDTVPGIREWRHSNTQWYKVGGEALWKVSGSTAFVGGFRLESLLTNFSDPDPNYLFTISSMDAQTMVTVYEPYVGIRLQSSPEPRGLTLQVVGFPFLFAAIQHLNVCNNAGVPFAHTGRQHATSGYFFEATAEYRLPMSRGVVAAAFVDWNVYRGTCTMTVERHEGDPRAGVTSATVGWSHDMSSLVLGGKIELAWNLPL